MRNRAVYYVSGLLIWSFNACAQDSLRIATCPELAHISRSTAERLNKGETVESNVDKTGNSLDFVSQIDQLRTKFGPREVYDQVENSCLLNYSSRIARGNRNPYKDARPLTCAVLTTELARLSPSSGTDRPRSSAASIADAWLGLIRMKYGSGKIFDSALAAEAGLVRTLPAERKKSLLQSCMEVHPVYKMLLPQPQEGFLTYPIWHAQACLGFIQINDKKSTRETDVSKRAKNSIAELIFLYQNFDPMDRVNVIVFTWMVGRAGPDRVDPDDLGYCLNYYALRVGFRD